MHRPNITFMAFAPSKCCIRRPIQSEKQQRVQARCYFKTAAVKNLLVQTQQALLSAEGGGGK
jgi:hypothetical protein